MALYDLKARRAGLSLAKLLGSYRESVACYNTSGGFLHTPLEQLLVNAAASRERFVHDLDWQHLCDHPKWVRLVWIEEPLDAYDHEGHAALAAQFDTPIATGEMLTSALEHGDLIRHRAADYLMPDAPRVGGITPFLKVAAQAEQAGLQLAPHFAMEIHLHLAAAYPREPWVEHFEWLNPLFNERLEIRDGRMLVPTRPGLGLTLSEQCRAWTRASAEAGQRP